MVTIFVQTGIANIQTTLSLPLSFLQERTTSNTDTRPKWIHGGNTARAPFFPHCPVIELGSEKEKTNLPLLCTASAAANRQETTLSRWVGIFTVLDHNVVWSNMTSSSQLDVSLNQAEGQNSKSVCAPVNSVCHSSTSSLSKLNAVPRSCTVCDSFASAWFLKKTKFISSGCL